LPDDSKVSLIRILMANSYPTHIPASQIAVKQLNSSVPVTVEKDFLQAAQLRFRCSHPYINSFLGIVLGSPMMMVCELANRGNFKRYIQENAQGITLRHQITWMKQIVKAMAYLETLSIVHRDLATRNIVLSSLGHVQIIHFSLACTLEPKTDHYIAKKHGKWPIKWLALECLLLGRFSFKVWS